MAAHQVRTLLMGGQACVFYGAGEFSRDTDLAVLAEAENLRRTQAAIAELEAQLVAVPSFSIGYLQKGHAVHFRCHRQDVAGMRVDLMSKLRGVAGFDELWARRTTINDTDGTAYELLSLPDLVQAKKTQCSKDWPMLRRLLEAHYLKHRHASSPDQQKFWFRELRTPELLVEAGQQWPQVLTQTILQRPLLRLISSEKIHQLENALSEEERSERMADRLYWQPLKLELEQLRHVELKLKRS